MVINLIVGVYTPIIRIPIKGGMTIPSMEFRLWHIWHFITPWMNSIWFSLLGWNAHESYMVRITSDCIKVSGASISQLQPCRVSIFVQGLVCLLRQRCAEGWPGGEKRGNSVLANHWKTVIQSPRAKIAWGRFSFRLTEMWTEVTTTYWHCPRRTKKIRRKHSTVVKVLMEVVCPLILA